MAAFEKHNENMTLTLLTEIYISFIKFSLNNTLLPNGLLFKPETFVS